MSVSSSTMSRSEAMGRSLGRSRNIDDEKYVAGRIKWHKDQVSKTVAYFEKLGKLKKINGNQPVAKVAGDIEKVIGKYKNTYHQ